MIEEMTLAGLARELAGNCAMKLYAENKIELALPPSQEHLLNPTQQQRLEQAIKNRFGDKLSLIITIEDPENETPAQAKARELREKQKAAEQSVQNDPTVQTLIDTFNATVDKDSIQPN